AAQGLPGLLDDVLDGEVLAGRTVAQQLEGSIDEPLDAALGPHPGRVQRPGYSLVTPARRRRLSCGFVGRHRGNGTASLRRRCVSKDASLTLAVGYTAGSATASSAVEPLSGTLG